MSSGYNMKRLVNGVWVDATGQEQVVGDEYLYEEKGGTRQQTYALPVVESIRLITTGAFRKRFSATVRKQIRDSVIDPVIILREDLESASYVDLDDQEVIDGLAGFSSAGLNWMTDEEIAAQLADGTTKEKYNGVL